MSEENNRPCNQCGAEPGEVHRWDDDIARCRSTGTQLIQCPGEIHEYDGREYGEHEGPCGPDIWDGEFPGVKDARKYGLYTSVVGIEGLTEDLNFLMLYGKYDPSTQSYVLPEDYPVLHEKYKARYA